MFINKLHESINIKEKLGGELSNAEDDIKSKIDKKPADSYIYILVQSPLLTTTDSKRKVEDLKENQAKKEKLEQEQEEQDKKKIRYLINSLLTINIDSKEFTVPALPGSKKSTVIYNQECYSYLLALLQKNFSVLLDNKDFMGLITPDGNLILVKDDEYRLFAKRLNTYCIIDGVELKVSHDFNGPKLIMVSSPNKEIIEKFMKAQNSRKFYMPIWRLEELNEC
ncbi:unnamed protein product [Rhizophagus irregularis]|nr:unnamed protein product [Rhizophagus irregularis]